MTTDGDSRPAKLAPKLDDGRTLRGPALALTLAGLMITLFLSVLDATIVGTALPRIVADLDGFDRYSWIATAYLLASTIMIPIVSKLSDMFGRKRQLIISVIGFVLGSALCGLATSMDQLIAFRALQGLAGGGLNSLVFAAVADIFSPAERGKWNGLFFGMITLATVLGPPVGGVITEQLGWRWIFYVNVPLCAIALGVLAVGFRGRVPARKASWRQFDFAGGLAIMVAIGAFLFAVVAGEDGFDWLAPIPLLLAGIAAGSLALFLRIERSAKEPVIPLHLFESRVIKVGVPIAAILAFSVVGTSLYAPLYIQTVIGDSPSTSGLVLLPYVVASLVANIATGQVVSRMGRYKPVMRLGCLLMPLGLGAFVLIGPTGDRLTFILCMIVFSIGFSMTAPALNVGMQNAFPADRMGAGTGVTTLMRSVGQVIGAALLGAVIIASFGQLLPGRIPASAATLPPEVVAEATDPRAFLVREGGQALAAPDPVSGELAAAVTATVGESIRNAFLVMAVLSVINAALVLFLLPDATLRRGRNRAEAAGAAGERDDRTPTTAQPARG